MRRRQRYQEGGIAALTGVGDPKYSEDMDQPLVSARSLAYNRGGLAMAVGGDVEEDEDDAPLTKQLMTGAEPTLSTSAAVSALETARTRLMEQRRPDKSAQWLALAQGMLSPTKTGSFGEAVGTTAGLLGKARATEKKRITDIDKELLEAEIDLEKVKTGYGETGAERQWNQLIAHLSPDERELATLIKLGIKPRAMGSAAITTALEEWSEMVADSEAMIAGRKVYAQKTEAQRAKTINDQYETITKLDANMRNLDRALDALHKGAKTGFIEKWVPSIRESSIILDQVQKELGLDIVGATTFGALSKGELDLALATAIPMSLEPPEMIEWLENRKAAQAKLRVYVMEAMDFFDTHEGATAATWLRHKEREMKGREMAAAEAAGGGGAEPGGGLDTLSDDDLAAAIREAGG